MNEELTQTETVEEESMQDVFNTLTDKQKELIFKVVGKAIEKYKAKAKHGRERMLG